MRSAEPLVFSSVGIGQATLFSISNFLDSVSWNQKLVEKLL